MADDLRPSTPQQRRALKEGVRLALRAAGGGESVQHATRICAALLSRYASPHEADRHCPVDVALDLDLEAGEPLIARALAEAEGWRLVRHGAAQPGRSFGARLSGILASTGQLAGDLSASLEDGELHPHEVAMLRADAAKARAVLDELDDALAALARRQSAADTVPRRAGERVRPLVPRTGGAGGGQAG